MKVTRSLSRRLPTITAPDGRVYPIIAGGADDDVEALLARLDSDTEPLTDEELAALEEALIAEFDAADGDDPDVDRMEEVAAQIEEVRVEQATREEEAVARQEAAAAVRERIHSAPAPDDDVEDEVEDEPTAEEDAPTAEVEDEPTAEAVEDDPEPEVEETPAAVAASTPASTPRPTRRAAAARRPSAHTPRPTPQRTGPTIVAAGDVPGVSAGSHLDSLDQVGTAFANKAYAVMSGQGRGRFPVASFQVEYPSDRFLGHNAEVNEDRIDSVVAGLTQDAIVASGGNCAPLNVSYDVDIISTDRRPLRDALVRFGADRGGIRFIAPPQLSDINTDVDGTYTADDDTAVVLWTEATDEEPGSNVKPVQTITCGAETTVEVDAITKALQVGNFNRKFFPEQFRAWWALAGAAHARVAEERIWDRMVALSTAVTTGQLLGASRDILENTDQAVAAFRSRHRMSDNAPLRMVFPDWTRSLMRADLVRQLPGDSTMAVTDAQIEAWFAVRNVNVTWTPDAGQEFGAQGAEALLRWPTTIEVLLYPDGHFLFLDGGTLDLGMEIRDSTLNQTNDVQAFVETFEQVAFRGVESLAITMDICPDGASSGTVDIDPCSTGS